MKNTVLHLSAKGERERESRERGRERKRESERERERGGETNFIIMLNNHEDLPSGRELQGHCMFHPCFLLV